MTLPSIDHLIHIARLALQFGRVYRITEDAENQRESDTTHTVMLAWIAGELAGVEQLDRSRVAVLALVHDMVEIKAGDTPTLWLLTEEEQAEKARREQAALEQLRGELQAFPWVLEALNAYTAQEEPEAKFVRLVDKLMPKLTHRLNQCRVPKEAGMTLEQFRERHAAQCAALRKQYPQFQRTHQILLAACADSEQCWFGKQETP